MTARQWPEVHDLCHTFLHVARFRKHTDVRELHAFFVQFSHIRVFSRRAPPLSPLPLSPPLPPPRPASLFLLHYRRRPPPLPPPSLPPLPPLPAEFTASGVRLPVQDDRGAGGTGAADGRGHQHKFVAEPVTATQTGSDVGPGASGRVLPRP